MFHRHDHRWHWHHLRMRHGMRHYVGARLHRRMFWWFGAAILCSAVVIGLLSHWLDLRGGPGGPRGLLVLAAPLLILWGMSGAIARRIARPLHDVLRVTEEIGRGNLGARTRLACCADVGEMAILSRAIDDMAGRIERQLADQRELLAAVSHELRTPLARLRLLLELARQGDPVALDEIEKEVVEVDDLVGELLANARLDFAAVSRRSLEGRSVGARALERADLPAERLDAEGDLAFAGDATLIARALANLLDNARKHGGGVRVLRVRRGDGVVAFTVEDGGPGFTPGEAERMEAALARGERPRRTGGRPEGSLGFGMALASRIARAHGGALRLANGDEGGARVTLEIS